MCFFYTYRTNIKCKSLSFLSPIVRPASVAHNSALHNSHSQEMYPCVKCIIWFPCLRTESVGPVILYSKYLSVFTTHSTGWWLCSAAAPAASTVSQQSSPQPNQSVWPHHIWTNYNQMLILPFPSPFLRHKPRLSAPMDFLAPSPAFLCVAE